MVGFLEKMLKARQKKLKFTGVILMKNSIFLQKKYPLKPYKTKG